MKSARNYSAPYTDTSFKTYLQDPSLTLATCWRLVSKSGRTVAATSHTRNLTLAAYPNVTFLAPQGVVPSAVDSEAGLSSAGLEVDGIFSVNVLDEESISNGEWDAAYFEVFTINYGIPEMGELVMFAGYIGNVKTYGQRFRAEGRPTSSKAAQEIGMIYAPKCDVRKLGDARCKTDLNAPAAGDGGIITVTGTVTGGASNIEFVDSTKNFPTGYFDFGLVQFTSGILNGKQSEIRSFIGTGTTDYKTDVSDNSWKWSSTNPSGWNTAGFDDSGWAASVEEATNGSLPWQTIPSFPSSSAKWIWSSYTIGVPSTVDTTVYFRKKFTPNVDSAVLYITADDEFTAYLNGVQITTGNNWHEVKTVTLNLNVGVENVIAISATNKAAASASYENPAGVLAYIKYAPYSPASGTQGIFSLQTPMSRVIPVGTTYTAIRGCDRKFETCLNVYANTINFRGFPFVPGVEKAYKINN